MCNRGIAEWNRHSATLKQRLKANFQNGANFVNYDILKVTKDVSSATFQLCPFGLAIFIVDVILNFLYLHYAFPSSTYASLSCNILSWMIFIKNIK